MNKIAYLGLLCDIVKLNNWFLFKLAQWWRFSLDEQKCLSRPIMRYSNVKYLIFFQICLLATVFPPKSVKMDKLVNYQLLMPLEYLSLHIHYTVIPSMSEVVHLGLFYDKAMWDNFDVVTPDSPTVVFPPKYIEILKTTNLKEVPCFYLDWYRDFLDEQSWYALE